MIHRGIFKNRRVFFLVLLATNFSLLLPKGNPARQPTLEELVVDLEDQYGKKPGELAPLEEAMRNPHLTQRNKELLERFARSALDAEKGDKAETANKRLLWRSPIAPHKTRDECLRTAKECAQKITENSVGRIPLLTAAQKIAEITGFEKQYEKSQPQFPPERAFEAAWYFFDTIQNIGSLVREFDLDKQFPQEARSEGYYVRLKRPGDQQDVYTEDQLRAAFLSAEGFKQFFKQLFSVEHAPTSATIDETKMVPVDLFMHCLPILASRLKAKKLPVENRQWLYFAATCMTKYNSLRHGDPAGLRRLTRFPVLSRSLKITASVAALSNFWRCCEELWNGYKEQRDATHEYPFSPENIAEIKQRTAEWEKKQKETQKARETAFGKSLQIQQDIQNNIAALKELEEE